MTFSCLQKPNAPAAASPVMENQISKVGTNIASAETEVVDTGSVDLNHSLATKASCQRAVMEVVSAEKTEAQTGCNGEQSLEEKFTTDAGSGEGCSAVTPTKVGRQVESSRKEDHLFLVSPSRFAVLNDTIFGNEGDKVGVLTEIEEGEVAETVDSGIELGLRIPLPRATKASQKSCIDSYV